MALLPPQLRPGFMIRRRATQRGLLGPSLAWKIVAAVILGRGTLKKVFGRHPEKLARRKIGAGHVISVTTSKPLSRKQRKASGITKASLAAAARADLDAAPRAS